MKPLLTLSFSILLFCSCGSDEAAGSGPGDDPLDQVPTAEEAAQEADSIDAENAQAALDELEGELNEEG